MRLLPVKKPWWLLLAVAVAGCEKELSIRQLAAPNTGMAGTTTLKKQKDTTAFTTYTIREGEQYCVGNKYPRYAAAAMRFTVQFDSSAIYTNHIASNQYDYNKLFGFSDNNSGHHSYSARFGWRWCNGELQLSAYTYNNGVRSIKDLGGIDMSQEHECAIVVKGDHYDFVLDGNTTSVPRASQTPKATGYKLLPYFGGDEAAPHSITIRIKEKS